MIKEIYEFIKASPDIIAIILAVFVFVFGLMIIETAPVLAMVVFVLMILVGALLTVLEL